MLENNGQINPVWDFYDSVTNAPLLRDYSRNSTGIPGIGDEYIGINARGSVVIVGYESKKTKNEVPRYDVYVKKLR